MDNFYYSGVAIEQFTFFLDTSRKFSPKKAQSEDNKDRLTGKPFDDGFQNASRKKGVKKTVFQRYHAWNKFFKKIIMN